VRFILQRAPLCGFRCAFFHFALQQRLGLALTAFSSSPTLASTLSRRSAYRRLSLLHHPDKPTGDQALFQSLAKAYEALVDPVARENWEK
jgi:hypothetical protein